jgi:hypothetical protein
MKIAYFDCFAGISGDMTLGALVGAGAPLDAAQRAVDALRLGKITFRRSTVFRSMIAAERIEVIEDGKAPVPPAEESPAHSHDHPRSAADHHHHDDGHSHAHERSLGEIVRLIEAAPLAPRVRRDALAMFRAIGVAEAKLHGVAVDEVHFHEVGAVDSIADVVGVAACLAALEIDAVYAGPVSVGANAMIETRHGPMPVPAPATIEILRGHPIRFTSHPFELATPTGAAVIAAFARGDLDREDLRVLSVGYGAGAREVPGLPNMLRVVVGELPESAAESVLVLETNIDDMNPQIYPFVMDKLFEAGAVDVYLTPIIMKKSRPGILLSAMLPEGAREAVLGVLTRETTTLGVRIRRIDREVLPRESLIADTPFGPMRVKESIRGGARIRTPEYEECRRVALEQNLPLIEIYRRLAPLLSENGRAQPG